MIASPARLVATGRRYRERYGGYIISSGIDYTLKDGYSEGRMLRHMRRVIGVRHSEEAL